MTAHAPRICGRQTEDGSICGGVVQLGEKCPKCGGSRHKFAGGRYRSDVSRSDTATHRALKRLVRERANGQCQIRYAGICLGAGTICDRVDNDLDYTESNCCWSCRRCHQRKTAWEAGKAQGHNVAHLEPRAIVQPPTPAPQPRIWRIDLGSDGHTQHDHGQGGISDDILSHWHGSR